MQTHDKNDMSTIMKSESKNAHTKQMQVNKTRRKETVMATSWKQQLTVSILMETMLEVIKVKKSQNMDEETRKQFPRIAKEILLLAEQIH